MPMHDSRSQLQYTAPRADPTLCVVLVTILPAEPSKGCVLCKSIPSYCHASWALGVERCKYPVVSILPSLSSSTDEVSLPSVPFVHS